MGVEGVQGLEEVILTAVARRSAVAGVGAVAVEGAPGLSALPSMFTVTRRAPGMREKAKKKPHFGPEQ